METNKEIVMKVLKLAFIERDAKVVDRYFVPNLRAAYSHHPERSGRDRGPYPYLEKSLLQDRHGRRGGRPRDGSRTLCRLGPKPLVAVDIFKVKDGEVVEHWVVMQEEVPVDKTATGNPMFSQA